MRESPPQPKKGRRNGVSLAALMDKVPRFDFECRSKHTSNRLSTIPCPWCQQKSHSAGAAGIDLDQWLMKARDGADGDGDQSSGKHSCETVAISAGHFSPGGKWPAVRQSLRLSNSRAISPWKATLTARCSGWVVDRTVRTLRPAAVPGAVRIPNPPCCHPFLRRFDSSLSSAQLSRRPVADRSN